MRRSLKQALAHKELTLGSWITLGHPAIAEIMARAGYDWLCVDMEHSVIDLNEAELLMRTIELAGAAPLVRLSNNDPIQIKRVMDAGAHGVIVPMVLTPAEAKAAVESVHYPPRGKRGVGLARAQRYGVGFAEYKQWLADEAVVIVQIEHIQAVENLESILAVDGVDGFILGPYDLSGSLGKPGLFDDPEVQAAIRRVEEEGPKSGKAPGIHVVEPDLAALERAKAAGYSFIAYSLDIRLLDVGCRAGLEVGRK